MEYPNEKIYFEIVSKKGIDTTSQIQEQFARDKKFYESLARENNVELIKENYIPGKGSMTTGIEFIIGLAGNMLASFIYDLIKDYKRGVSSFELVDQIEQSDYTTIDFESADYKIRIRTSLKDLGQIKDLIDSITSNRK